ncbi:MAG: acyl-CoA dehydrogenase family protein [Bdellovibrionia bacterium]
MSYLEKLNNIIGDHIAKNAVATDQTGAFPRASITALGKAGLLGLMSSKDMGGMGLGLSEANTVVETIAKVCPSTAMIVTMHYSATAVIEKLGNENTRRAIAKGEHLTTLAWSEFGSRSHFWAPVGTARRDQTGIVVDSQKSFVTSAYEADSYVWTSKPVAAEGVSTMWLVEKNNVGLKPTQKFDGLGLRGNASAPMTGEGLKLSESAMLGADGKAFDTMIGVVLPVFCTLSASCSLGIMEATVKASVEHVTGNDFKHLDASLATLPTIRAYVAQARMRTDMIRTLRDDTISALGAGRPDAMLRVMEVKAAAADMALEVTDIAMRVCGGAAFRKDTGIERFMRDARASHVMAPTTDVLYDFIGKAVCGMPVFG